VRIIDVVLIILQNANPNSYLVTITNFVASADEVVPPLSERFLLQPFVTHGAYKAASKLAQRAT
jgi:hypothetical protein